MFLIFIQLPGEDSLLQMGMETQLSILMIYIFSHFLGYKKFKNGKVNLLSNLQALARMLSLGKKCSYQHEAIIGNTVFQLGFRGMGPIFHHSKTTISDFTTSQ